MSIANLFTLYPDGLPIESTQWTREVSESDILRQFYLEVCVEAEKIMAQTNTVSGAHWNAMQRILKRKGVL